MARSRVVVPELADEVVEIEPGNGEPQDPDAGDLEHLTTAGNEWRWAVYRRLAPEERARYGGSQRVLLTFLEGAIDVLQFQREWGGGTFEFWGTITGERGLRKKPVISLAGPLKPLNAAEPTPTPVPQSAPPSLSADNLAIVRALDAIVSKLNTMTTSREPRGLTFDDVVKIAALMNGNRSEGFPKEMFEVFKEGLSLGATREPGDKDSLGEMIVKQGMPALERIATAMMTKRAAPNVKRQPRPVPEAQVVETPTGNPTPAPHVDDFAVARWTTLVGSLARAVEEQDDPEDFAATVERIMFDDEVDGIAMSTADDIMRELKASAAGRFPILEDPRARTYVESVIQVLKNTAEPQP